MTHEPRYIVMDARGILAPENAIVMDTADSFDEAVDCAKNGAGAGAACVYRRTGPGTYDALVYWCSDGTEWRAGEAAPVAPQEHRIVECRNPGKWFCTCNTGRTFDDPADAKRHLDEAQA